MSMCIKLVCVCVSVCAYIHTCHMPQLGGGDFIIPYNTCNNSSLFSLSSFKSDNKSMHLYSTHICTCTAYYVDILCLIRDTNRILIGCLAVVLTLSHTRAHPRPCACICVYMYLSTQTAQTLYRSISASLLRDAPERRPRKLAKIYIYIYIP